MPTKNPRLQVCLNKGDYEVLAILSEKKNTSMSTIAKRMIEKCLEDYEDMVLAQRAEKIENDWIARGCPTISHEDLCRELDIK